MSGINPISGVSPGSLSAAMNPAARRPGENQGFADLVRNSIHKVNQDQALSGEAIQDLLAGKTQDILPVVSAVAKADLSFKLLMGVRNKIIEAYKQTMNMQV